MLLWIILAVVAAVVIYAIVVFNSLVRTRQMVNEAWSGIDVQLKRRSDLVPNLVDTVKGYAAHERGVLERVTHLRGAAQTLPAGDVASCAQAEGALSAALRQLFAVAENYPDLKASANFLQLQQQLSDLENELQMARRRAQLTLDGAAPLDMGVHRRLEKTGGRAAFGLGAVEREIGAAHQLVCIGAVVRGDRDADADAQRGLIAGDEERFGRRRCNAARERGRFG